MRLSKGFTLVDVIVGLLISSMLSVVLYRVFSQTMRIAHVSSGLIEDYSDLLIMSAQVERDITSVVVLKEHETSEKKEPASSEKPAVDKQASAVELSGGEKEKDEENKEEQLAFSGIIKDNKLSSLSFVCTNALPDVDKVGSRLVRVRYFLAPEPSDASLSRLMREERTYAAPNKSLLRQGFEGQALGSPGQRGHAYPVMTRIESITVKFYGTVHTPEGAQKSASSEG